MKYKIYWKTVKRRCIEGYWVDGKYMPGPLYYYANFGRILMHKEGSKTKSIGRPNLRDVEWDKAYVYLEAKGFSGFDGDPHKTCSHWVDMVNQEKDNNERGLLLSSLISRGKIRKQDVTNPDEFPNNPKLKTFEHPRTYMRKEHIMNFGRPLYHNNASNVIDIECRRIGKSMFAANGLINHNFLFDGATDYDSFLAAQANGQPYSSETLVGAIDAKYTKDLLSKCQMGLDNLPGSQTVNGSYYPSPLSKQYRGSFAISKYVEAAYEMKNSGGWTTKGSKSKIHNRSFADNPLAGNGTGPNLVVFEEVGFMTNLIDSLGAMKDATYEGSDKFGVIWMTGTGGEMDAAAVSDTKKVFFNPESFDCLVFEDIWEETSGIGYFVPYVKRLDEFRDSEGNIDEVASAKYVETKREKLRKGKSKRALYSEMQNNPNVPSEAFLVDNSNIFPTAELKAHLGWLQSNEQDKTIAGQCGTLERIPNEAGEVTLQWKPDLRNRLSPCDYNMDKSDDTTGCIQIWEHPQTFGGTAPPFGLYLAGTDPYDQDQAATTASFGSTFIYKTFHTEVGIYNWPVAEYTARPATAAEHHETVRKLLLYYNAVDLYENERNTIKMHFEHKHSLYLLAKTPTILKATENTTVQRQYGIHMTKQIKSEIELYTRDWLEEEIGDGRLNLHKIYSQPLLKELIAYNDHGNFDRVIAFMLTILHTLQNHHMKVTEKTKDDDGFLTGFLSRAPKFYK